MEGAVLDPGSVGRGREGGHSSLLGGLHSDEGRSVSTARFGRQGICWRLEAVEEARGLEEGLGRPLGIFTEDTADLDPEGRARKCHVKKDEKGRQRVQSIEA